MKEQKKGKKFKIFLLVVLKSFLTLPPRLQRMVFESENWQTWE